MPLLGALHVFTPLAVPTQRVQRLAARRRVAVDRQTGRRAVEDEGEVVPQAVGPGAGGHLRHACVEVGQRVAAQREEHHAQFDQRRIVAPLHVPEYAPGERGAEAVEEACGGAAADQPLAAHCHRGVQVNGATVADHTQRVAGGQPEVVRQVIAEDRILVGHRDPVRHPDPAVEEAQETERGVEHLGKDVHHEHIGGQWRPNDLISPGLEELARLHGQRRVVVGDHANRVDRTGCRDPQLSAVRQLELQPGLPERVGADECLVVGVLDRLLEVVAELEVVAPPRLEGQPLGLALQHDHSVGEHNEDVDVGHGLRPV